MFKDTNYWNITKAQWGIHNNMNSLSKQIIIWGYNLTWNEERWNDINKVLPNECYLCDAPIVFVDETPRYTLIAAFDAAAFSCKLVYCKIVLVIVFVYSSTVCRQSHLADCLNVCFFRLFLLTTTQDDRFDLVGDFLHIVFSTAQETENGDYNNNNYTR